MVADVVRVRHVVRAGHCPLFRISETVRVADEVWRAQGVRIDRTVSFGESFPAEMEESLSDIEPNRLDSVWRLGRDGHRLRDDIDVLLGWQDYCAPEGGCGHQADERCDDIGLHVLPPCALKCE